MRRTAADALSVKRRRIEEVVEPVIFVGTAGSSGGHTAQNITFIVNGSMTANGVGGPRGDGGLVANLGRG